MFRKINFADYRRTIDGPGQSRGARPSSSGTRGPVTYARANAYSSPRDSICQRGCAVLFHEPDSFSMYARPGKTRSAGLPPRHARPIIEPDYARTAPLFVSPSPSSPSARSSFPSRSIFVFLRPPVVGRVHREEHPSGVKDAARVRFSEHRAAAVVYDRRTASSAKGGRGPRWTRRRRSSGNSRGPRKFKQRLRRLRRGRRGSAMKSTSGERPRESRGAGRRETAS